MIRRVEQFSPATQNTLKQAACIGNRFALNTLATVCQQTPTEVAEAIWPVVQLGLVIPEGHRCQLLPGETQDPIDSNDVSSSYQFLHDRVQQAVYSLIPNHEKAQVHFRIGQLLRNTLSIQQQQEKLFEIVNQLNLGISLVTLPLEQEQLARLNLEAGVKAKSSTAYSAASQYLSVAESLILQTGWDKAYNLMLKIYEESVECAYLNTDFQRSEVLAKEAFQYTKTVLDQIKLQVIQIHSNIAQNKLIEAIHIALQVLKQLDKTLIFPKELHPTDFNCALAETQANLEHHSIDDLIHLPQMSDPQQLAAMEILNSVLPACYLAKPELYPFLIMRMVNLSLNYGNTEASTIGYVTYGSLNCGLLNDLKTGYQFGQLALGLVEKFNATNLKAKVVFAFGEFIQHWQAPVSQSLKSLQSALGLGLESGDFVNAAYSASWYCYNSIFLGKNLDRIEEESENLRKTITPIKQKPALTLLSITQQTIYNLQGKSDSPFSLVGKAYNEPIMLPQHRQDRDILCLAVASINSLILCYTFDEYERAATFAVQAEQYLNGVLSTLCIPLFYFYDSLIKLAHVKHSDRDRERLAQVKQNQARMKVWVEYTPTNYLHKYYLVEAEYERVIGHNITALEYYDQAIAHAKQHHFQHEEALANELAAKFFLDWNKETVAAGYMQEAYYCYIHWGAKAKTEHLVEVYPHLLRPVLQKHTPSLAFLDTFSTINPPTTTQAHNESLTGQSSISEALDLATIIKSAQILASKLELKPLIANLMNLMIKSSGAETCALILPGIYDTEHSTDLDRKKDWFVYRLKVEALEKKINELNASNEYYLDKPRNFIHCSDIPTSIIHYVKRSEQAVHIDNLKGEQQSITDEYLLQYQPQSVLVQPILHQGIIIGVLYLENRVTANVFNPTQRNVINFFCNQAAIALENAKLYQKQANQAQTLTHKNNELQVAKKAAESANQAKTKFLQHVSHELRTPLNGIMGYTQILGRDMTLSKVNHHGIEAIQHCGKTLLTLVDNIIDIARMDADELELKPEEINLPSFLIDILGRFQQKAENKGIQLISQIISERPDSVVVDQKRLRQVLEHLLDNGIKYTEQGSVALQVALVALSKTRATLSFQVIDTGIGIDQDEQAEILQLFSQGTNDYNRAGGLGMGLAISQRILQGMGSELEVKSTLGLGSQISFILDLPLGQPDLQRPVAESLETTAMIHRDISIAVAHSANDLILPDIKVLQALLKLSELGRIKQVKTKLEEILEQDKDLQPFANEILNLVKQFKIEKIESLLTEYLAQATHISE